MRLNEIDPDSVGPGQKVSAHELVGNRDTGELEKYIRQHCSDAIQYMKDAGKYFYRGMRPGKGLGSAIVGQSRQDREPKDTKDDISAFFDQALTSHGFKALRRNSIFVTSDKSNAEIYGPAYAIFPMNGFNYTYTNQVDLVIRPAHLVNYPKDLVEDTKQWFADFKSPGGPGGVFYYAVKQDLQGIDRLRNDPVATAYYLTTTKASLCSNLAALAIYVKDDPYLQKFKDFNNEDPKNWSYDAAIENLEPKSTDIQYAMKKGLEICISGKYVAVPSKDPFTKMLRKIFLQ